MKKLVSIILIIGLIASLALFGLIACKNTTYNYKDAKKYHVGAGTYASSEVKAINVAWAKGEIHITCSDEYTEVSVSEENTVTDEKYVLHQYVDKKGTLWVKPYASKIDEDNIPEFEKKILTITMPKIMLDSAYIEGHGYDSHVSGINTKELETYMTGYTTYVTGAVVTQKLDMKATGITGGNTLSGAINAEVKISSASEAHFTTSATPTSIDISAKRALSIVLPDTITGYSATITKATNFTSDWETTDISEDTEAGTITKKAGDGSLTIVAKCSTSSIGSVNNTSIRKYVPAE